MAGLPKKRSLVVVGRVTIFIGFFYLSLQFTDEQSEERKLLDENIPNPFGIRNLRSQNERFGIFLFLGSEDPSLVALAKDEPSGKEA